MTKEYVALRRLYMGGGEYVNPSEPVKDINPAHVDALLASGAIAEKKAPQVDNKMEPVPENKAAEPAKRGRPPHKG